MTGNGQLGRLTGDIFRWAERTYVWHRALFIGLNLVLTAVNYWMGPPWWGIWPLLITGALFTLHYLIYKTATVDEDWVDDRAADVYDRSYDQGHIDSIANHHDLTTVIDRKSEEIRQKRGRARGRDDNGGAKDG